MLLNTFGIRTHLRVLLNTIILMREVGKKLVVLLKILVND